MAASSRSRMLLLIDENVPNSVAKFFAARGHDVRFVRELFPAGTPDPVIATIGDRLSAIVVTWDRDLEDLVRRVPQGNRAKFRRLGRISFRCNETRGEALLRQWIEVLEFHYELAMKKRTFRMIVQIQESGFKLS
jgi:predicted nuclease of predicted toxin-antitoxin system